MEREKNKGNEKETFIHKMSTLSTWLLLKESTQRDMSVSLTYAPKPLSLNESIL